MSLKDDPVLVKQLWKRALIQANKILRKNGIDDGAEDVAQEVIMSFIRYEEKHGTRSKQTIEQACIEGIRKCFGDTRFNSSRFRNPRNRYEPRTEEPGVDYIETLADTAPGYSGEFERAGELFDQHSFALNWREYVIANLTLNDFDQVTIAEILGVTQSRICQTVRHVKEKIEDVRLFHEREEFIEDGRTKLWIDWITL